MIFIYVWKPSEKTRMGHASMMIDAGDAKRKVYVSWYPSDLGSGDAYIWEVEYCSQGKSYKTLKDELEHEWGGKRPDLAVTIHGLQEGKMKKVWERLKKEDQWCLAKKNCATVVYILLRAGGAPKAEEVHSSEKLAWAEPEDEGTASKIARVAKNAWSPLRLYNYANTVSQMPRKK